MMRCGKRLLALMLTVGMVLSCISPAVSATAVEPEGHTHDNPVLLSAEDPSYVPGTACYVQYDLNNDGVLSGKDAVELLGRATQPDVYQGEQIDVDGDGDCDTQDAIALLKIALWPEKYGHAGKVHAFSGEPVWQWSADGKAAVAVFKCACGQETSEITALVARNVGKEATCTEAGFVSATASVTFLGTTYSDNKVTELPATGHTFAAEADCTTSAACTKCDYVMPASGHNYVKTAEQAADCTHEASETYTCSVCHDSYTVKTGEPVHSYAYDREELKDGETCIFEQVLKCSQCGAEIPGETVEHHAYKASVTQEPTCQTAGVKTYTCTKCGDSYTESIPATADGHNWQDKGSGNYECANCGATKTVVVAADNKVAAGDLENGGEVQLSGDVSVTLDEATANQLTGELTLNVSKLSEAEKEAVLPQVRSS